MRAISTVVILRVRLATVVLCPGVSVDFVSDFRLITRRRPRRRHRSAPGDHQRLAASGTHRRRRRRRNGRHGRLNHQAADALNLQMRQPASIRSAVISKKLLMTYFNAKSDHILSTAQFTTPTTTNLQETRLPNLTSIT